MTELLTEQQAARLLHMSVKCLQGWRSRGGGPPFLKLGLSVRYAVPALEAFVQEAERRSTSDPGPGKSPRSGIQVERLLDNIGRRRSTLAPDPEFPASRPKPR